MQSESSFFSGSPKNLFYTGAILGVAASAIIALGVMVMVLFNGKTAIANDLGNGAAVVDPFAGQPSQPVAYAPVKDVDAKIDHIRGPKNAKVTLIEYSDFECPFCGRHLPSINQALKDFPKDVRFVYRHYPLSFHPNGQSAAEASECAAKVGGEDKFWQMHDKLFENQTNLGRDTYVKIAKEIGLNEGKFTSCLDSGEMKARVAADQASGNDAGVEGTPATFVNGSLVSGAVPYATLKAAIESAGGKE